jgi:hypothetical protein
MKTIIDDTIDILKEMGVNVQGAYSPPGYVAIDLHFPNESQALFVWSKMDQGDFHFRLARFWEKENPFSLIVCSDLIIALTRVKELVKL